MDNQQILQLAQRYASGVVRGQWGDDWSTYDDARAAYFELQLKWIYTNMDMKPNSFYNSFGAIEPHHDFNS